MKKLFYIALIALAGLSMTSCYQDHIDAVYNPAYVVSQSMQDFGVGEYVLAEDGANIETTFTPADFGKNLAVTYALYVADNRNMNDMSKMTASISVTDGVGLISLSQKDLNSYILNAGGEADEAFTLYFRLRSYMMNDKGSAIESTMKDDIVKAAVFIPYDAELLDVDKYPHVWVIGASDKVGAWAHDKVYQFLYDYAGNGEYSGLIDFGEGGSQFKLTGAAAWGDDTGNWGCDDQTSEASKLQLANGSNTNIDCYAMRFYKFSFNKSSLGLTKEFGFNSINIVGSFNGWDPADANMTMAYNDFYHRFYIDATFNEGEELKFTCDGGWDLNWGDNMEQGGPNIVVPGGSYRVYLDFNKNSFEFNAKMFGQEEPGAPEPEPGPEPQYEGWGIIGSFNDWGGDAPMTEVDGIWTGYVTLAADAEWKLRKDAAWDENVGGTFSAFDVPFAVEQGGANIMLGQEGFFKVVFDPAAGTITVSEGEVWSLIGGFNDWSGDVDMTKEGDLWVVKNVALSGEWKIRKNHDWGVNRGGSFEELGTPFTVEDGGANIDCGEGKFNITYNPADETVTVDAALPSDTWSLIGGFNGWSDDVFMTELTPGVWVSPATQLSGEFKLRFNHDWGVNRGGDGLEMGKIALAYQDGSNFNVEEGTYVVVYDANLEFVYLQGWSLIGSLNGTGWDKDFPMTPIFGADDDGEYSGWKSDAFYADESTEIKIRYDGGWDANRGGNFTELCVPFDAVPGGDNLKFPESGYYMLFYDPAKEQMLMTDASWSIIGGFNSWSGDVPMWSDSEGVYSGILLLKEDSEVKLRCNRGWDLNAGGTMEELDKPFEVTNGGDNIALEAGRYFFEFDSVNMILTISALEEE